MSNNTTAVIVTRNDNYGGNLRERATICLNAMCFAFDEVIVVDWNSPEGPLIDSILRDIDTHNKLTHITVSPQLVEKILAGRDAQDCCEVLGRNIGIRAAKHEWILSTNIDIVSPRLVGCLSPDTLYTVARYDVPREFWLEQLELKDAIENLEILEGIAENLERKGLCTSDDFSLVQYCGDFQLAHRDLWNTIRGFEESMLHRCYADSNLMLKAKLSGYKLDVLPVRIYHLDHYNITWYGQQLVTPRNDKSLYLNPKVFRQTENCQMEWGCTEFRKEFKIEYV